MTQQEQPEPEKILEQIASNQNGAEGHVPKDATTYVETLMRGGGGGDFFSEEDKLQGAILELFDIPGDMTDLETLKKLLIRSDLPEHQVKLVSRVLALSQIFEPTGTTIDDLDDDLDDDPLDRELGAPSIISVPRIIIAWYLLARIASERQGRKEYAAVLGYQLEQEARAGDDV